MNVFPTLYPIRYILFLPAILIGLAYLLHASHEKREQERKRREKAEADAARREAAERARMEAQHRRQAEAQQEPKRPRGRPRKQPDETFHEHEEVHEALNERNKAVWAAYGPGYFKVAQSGGSLVSATFWNPFTGDVQGCTVRDDEYGDWSRDKPELYDAPINADVAKLYRQSLGELVEGDTVLVAKGKRIPVGTVGVIDRFRKVTNRYGYVVAIYAVLQDGQDTNIENLVLVTKAPVSIELDLDELEQITRAYKR